jgi:F-type H+-transporting ATPase subunit epsilon
MALGPHAESEAHILSGEVDVRAAVGGKLAVTVVTPTGSVVAGEADEIVAPGVEGEFGVLPGHVAFISALRAGVLTVRSRDRRDVYAVGPGYLQVAGGGKTQVLVQQAVSAGDIDVDEARAELADADGQLKQASGVAGEQGALAARRAWAAARLEAVSRAGK